MHKFLVTISLVCVLFKTYSQNKKVAVVTFYADKRVNLTDFGLERTADILKLDQDPDFNMAPMLNNFHAQFFGDYSKSFPFQLVPEEEVFNNEDYKSFAPQYSPDVVPAITYTAMPGYKAIDYNWGTKNEDDLVKIFDKYDGIMFVFIDFRFIKNFAFNGTGTYKVKAFTHIALLNKEGKKVFNITEFSNSKKTGVMIGGVPVLKPENILPMCESALIELMDDLQKRLPKMIKKSEEKL